MRSTSIPFRQAVYSERTKQMYALLLTIDHPDLDAPIRISNDNLDTFELEGQTVRGTISNGGHYVYLPVRVTWPDDSEETISQAQIEIDNVSSRILASIRALQKPPTVVVTVVLAATADVVEATTGTLYLQDVSADRLLVTARLTRRNFAGEPYPGGTCTPSNFPGMFP